MYGMMGRNMENYKIWYQEYKNKPEVIEHVKNQAKKYHQREDVKDRRKSKKYREYKRSYEYKRRQENKDNKFIDSLRNRQKQVLKGITSTTKGLGCTKQELRVHLKTQFLEGMSFNNYGNKKDCWSIDHILPLSSYKKDENGNWDLNSEYNKKLIHYTNLQPMWHVENVKKNNTIVVL